MATGRSILIQKPCSLSSHFGQLKIKQEDQTAVIPLTQIGEIIVETSRSAITSAVLQKLAEENIPVILCNEKHTPIAELSSFSGNFERAGKIMDQMQWEAKNKQAVWISLISEKIRCQKQVLLKMGIPVPSELEHIETALSNETVDYMEAQSARIYFQALFGTTFSRRRTNDINACLNYGYAILLSTANRIIRSHGYITEVGIHHCSRTNPHNFSCDIMEPFRPVIDYVICKTGKPHLSPDFRKKLIDITFQPIHYNEKEWKVGDAMEQFFLDIIAAIETQEARIGGFIID